MILDNQVGEIFVATLLPRLRKWERWWRPKIAFWTDEIEEYTVDKLLERLDCSKILVGFVGQIGFQKNGLKKIG